MKIYTDKRLLACGLVGGTVSRHSGNMRELTAQASVYKELGIAPEKILHLHQVHGDRMIAVSSEQAARAQVASAPADADAWLLSPMISGWGAAIVTADCVPLFLWTDDGAASVLAHCGWRGVVQGLSGKAALTLLKSASQRRIYAWLGPHIQACCFEVQADVANQFPVGCLEQKNGKTFVNLTTEITRQLVRAGVAQADIHAPYYCTCGDKENFFSWRRDHEKNLLLSFIYKP